MTRVRKSPNMMSTTGRIPVIAAPTASPVIPASEIGESITRSGAELVHQAGQHLERRARLGNVLADHEHPLVAPKLLGQRLVDRLAEGQLAGHDACLRARRRHASSTSSGSGNGASSANARPLSTRSRTSCDGSIELASVDALARAATRPAARSGRAPIATAAPPRRCGSRRGRRRRRGGRGSGRCCTCRKPGPLPRRAPRRPSPRLPAYTARTSWPSTSTAVIPNARGRSSTSPAVVSA